MDFSVNYLIDKTINGTGDIDAHLMTLFSLALSIKAKNMVELGVRLGHTTTPLLLAAQKLNAKLYSVDILNRVWDIPFPEELTRHWEFHEKDSVKFLNQWDKNTPIDLILIDDLHTYEHVAQELKIIRDLVTPSSIVLLHDLMYANWEPKYHTDRVATGQWANGGPYRAVSELDKELWEFSTIPSCNGLTILRKRGDK